jgi:hypothetical protein
MYIAKKEGFAGSWDYFQDNVNDSPKWTKEKTKAKRFGTKEQAQTQSDITKLYKIIVEEVD